MWARRLLIGSGFALASVIAVPSVAGASGCGSMSGPTCSVTQTVGATSTTPPTQSPAAVSPATTPASSSSLPFTGADIEQMAGVGVGAVLLGSILIRRRRRPIAD